MLDTVPWMVAGGAIHSAEVGRALAYHATGGNSGVTEGRDFAVRQLSTAGTSVRVGPGTAAIVNTYSGQTGQSYIARNTDDENVTITQTAGTARSDMLVLRIDDPQYGGTEPEDEEVGPYVRFHIIPNVGSTATEIPAGTPYPAIPLTRIDIPANTGTITQSMLKDLRTIANPKTRRLLRMLATPTNQLSAVNPSQQSWPLPTGTLVAVPKWATHAAITAQIIGVSPDAAPSAGFINLRLGADNEAKAIVGSGTGWNASPGATPRINLATALDADIPAELRGRSIPLALKASRFGSGYAGITASADVQVIFDIEFSETPTVV
jgi:hypothetical protein